MQALFILSVNGNMANLEPILRHRAGGYSYIPARFPSDRPPRSRTMANGDFDKGYLMFATHLESALDGTRVDGNTVQTVHNGRPLWVRYDLAAVRKATTPADIATRPPSLWRYRELLPLPADHE